MPLLTKDDLGFIWIATTGGIARFDGHRFETIPMPEDSVTSISDSYGSQIKFIKGWSIIVTTKMGMYIYDLIKGKWNLVQSQTKDYIIFAPSFLVPFADSIFAVNVSRETPIGLDMISKNGSSHSLFKEDIHDLQIEMTRFGALLPIIYSQ